MIKCCSKIKSAFRIGWRQVSGILSSLKKWIQIPEVPKKSQISERFNELKFDYQESIIREKHKVKSPFLKLHVAVNTKPIRQLPSL